MRKDIMMKTIVTSSLFFVSTLALAQPHQDAQCSLQLEQDLKISPALVELADHGQSLWKIDRDGNLWLEGQSQRLTTEQRQLLQQYQAGLRDGAEQTAVLVADAMKLAMHAVSEVMTELTGNDISDYDELQSAFDKVELSSSQLIVRDGSNVEIRGSQLDQLDDAFGPEFEQAMESAIKDSMGSILVQLGTAMMFGDGDFEQRMEAFGERMDRMGDRIEQSVNVQASVLEQQGDELCGRLSTLTLVEQQLQQSLPVFKTYQLLGDKHSDVAVNL